MLLGGLSHFGGYVVFFFVEFADFGEFAFGFRSVAHGLVQAAKAEMGVWSGWIELDSGLKGCHCLWVVLLLHQDDTQVEVRHAQVSSLLHGFFQVGKGLAEVVFLHRDVAQIGERLGVIWVYR